MANLAGHEEVSENYRLQLQIKKALEELKGEEETGLQLWRMGRKQSVRPLLGDASRFPWQAPGHRAHLRAQHLELVVQGNQAADAAADVNAHIVGIFVGDL